MRWITQHLRCLGMAIFMAMASAQGAALSLLAHYGFEGDARDTTGNHAPFELLWNAGISNGVICTPRAFESDAGTPVLSDLSYRSFTVAVDFKLTEFVPYSGNILSGGPSYRWFGLEADGGMLALRLSLKDGSWFVPFENARLRTNQWYQVVSTVDLDAGRVRVFLNGLPVGEVDVGRNAEFNVVGTSSEPWDKVFSFRNHGNASTLVGCADNLQIYSRAASDAEVVERIAPRIRITSSGGTALVSAPRVLTGYKLQSSETPGSPSSWVPVSATPAMTGDFSSGRVQRRVLGNSSAWSGSNQPPASLTGDATGDAPRVGTPALREGRLASRPTELERRGKASAWSAEGLEWD